MYVHISLYARLSLVLWNMKCTPRYCTVMHTNGSTASTTNYCINLTTVIDFENADGIAAHSPLPLSLSSSFSLHELRKWQLAKGKAEAGSGRHIPNPSLTAGQSQSPNLAKVNFGHCSKSLRKDTKVIHSFIHSSMQILTTHSAGAVRVLQWNWLKAKAKAKASKWYESNNANIVGCTMDLEAQKELPFSIGQVIVVGVDVENPRQQQQQSPYPTWQCSGVRYFREREQFFY